MLKPKKIYVGLSGGVDSAVSAALLKAAGHDVTGVFIKIWSPEFLECTWREDRLDAMRVAVHLGIPFREINLSQEYKESVVADMIGNYKKGITPNPDVLCNKTVKFGAFMDWAMKQGADAIATGHYARIEHDQTQSLLKGIDPAKDQSYFLYRLTKEDLRRSYFPVGGFTKKEIRVKAQEFKLPNAQRPDSQGLCFVGDVSMPEFLSRFIVLEKGILLNEQNERLGEHDGSALYTIGQRHGFRLDPSVPEGPYYVTAIDIAKNTVQVSKTKSATEHTRATLDAIHWIDGPKQRVEGVTRYHGKSVHATIDADAIVFDEPTLLTPGQSVVFYDRDVCLGGAVIKSVESSR